MILNVNKKAVCEKTRTIRPEDYKSIKMEFKTLT